MPDKASDLFVRCLENEGVDTVIDVVDMMAPITKYTKQIVSASAIPSRIRNAFRLAEEERPGAVHLELPEDVARESTGAAPITESYHRRPIVEDKAVERALELLREARHPVLLIGAAANRKMTSKMLRAFVDKQGIPFVTTQTTAPAATASPPPTNSARPSRKPSAPAASTSSTCRSITRRTAPFSFTRFRRKVRSSVRRNAALHKDSTKPQ